MRKRRVLFYLPAECVFWSSEHGEFRHHYIQGAPLSRVGRWVRTGPVQTPSSRVWSFDVFRRQVRDGQTSIGEQLFRLAFSSLTHSVSLSLELSFCFSRCVWWRLEHVCKCVCVWGVEMIFCHSRVRLTHYISSVSWFLSACPVFPFSWDGFVQF